MRTFGFLFLILVNCCLGVNAQDYLPIHSTVEKYQLRKIASLHIDTSTVETLKNATELVYHPLDYYKIPELLFESYRYNYFLRVGFFNAGSDTLKFLLTAGEFWRQELMAVSKISGSHFSKGYQAFNETDRAYEYDHKYFPLTILPHDTLRCFIKINDLTGKPFIINPVLISYNQEAKERVKALYKERPPLFINTAFYALLLNMVFIAFTLFYFSKQRYLIYFGLYVLFLLGYNVYGFSYSSYTITFIDYFPLLKFQLRQTFYILSAQIALVFFVRGFINVKTDGNNRQKVFFKILIWVYSILLGVELIICLIFNRYDWELYNAIISELAVSLLGLALLINIFRWKNLDIPLLFKIGGACLLFGGVYGFISAALGWVNNTSIIFLYYPEFIFILFVFLALSFFSSAILERFFKNFTEQGRLQKQYAMSELSLLRSQINPHFLFNTLNSIKSSLFFSTPKESAKYLTDFSDLVRLILEKSREHIVSLKEELEITEQYLQLEQRRFEKPFVYFIDKELNLNFEQINVPAFILQPFVENAIKHGFRNISHKGLIRISIESQDGLLKIFIDDNGVGRKSAAELGKWLKPHQSMGQQLISNRIKLLNEIYEWGIEIKIEDLYEPSGTKVILHIPLMN